MPSKKREGSLDITPQIIERLQEEQSEIMKKFPMLLHEPNSVDGVRMNPDPEACKKMSLSEQHNAATRVTNIEKVIKELKKETGQDYDPKKAEAIHGKLVDLRKECNQLTKKKTFGFLGRATALDKAVSTAKKACPPTFVQKYILPKLGRK